MEKVADVLKIFFEKHLIPSIISVVGSIMALFLVSSDNLILLKLGRNLFFILFFCLCFLFTQLVFLVIKAISKALKDYKERQFFLEQEERRNLEAKRKLNDFLDDLSPANKAVLMTFVQNGNKVLLNFRSNYSVGDLLSNANIVNSSAYSGDIRCFDKERFWITESLEQTLLQGMTPIGELRQYKLREPYYEMFSSILRSEGKLGNF